MENITQQIEKLAISKAGGKNTTLLGKNFENLTNSEKFLLENGFVKIIMNSCKYGYYLYKKLEEQETEIFYVTQSGFKIFMKKFYSIDAIRHPDEAYIIKTPRILRCKILEKKEQVMEGSVETKLWAAPALKREYEIMLECKFIIEYVFCVNKFIESKFLDNDNKKYQILAQIFRENNIAVLFGEREKYYSKLSRWIYNF